MSDRYAAPPTHHYHFEVLYECCWYLCFDDRPPVLDQLAIKVVPRVKQLHDTINGQPG